MNITKAEVFSYDNCKTFGYYLEMDNISVEMHLNKISLTVIIKEDFIYDKINILLNIDDNYKILSSISAVSLRKMMSVLSMQKCNKKSAAETMVVRWVRDININMQSAENQGVFEKYVNKNEKHLDYLEGDISEADKNHYKNKMAENDVELINHLKTILLLS